MKILFISHKFYPDIGGIEVNSQVLATCFQSMGHEVRLLTWSIDHTLAKFPFVVIRNPNLNTILEEHRNCDMVFENNPSLRLSWPSLFCGKPKVVALRTWITRVHGKKSWQDWIKSFWLSTAKAVIAVSDEVRKRCWNSAVVIGNPYRDELFRVVKDVDRSKYFVFMGRLVSDKGVDIALNAFKSLIHKDGFEHLNFTIVGDGPEMQNLLELVEKLNLNDKVTFKGPLRGEQLVSCLNEHRFILVPSTWEEPFGNVVLEGMACGCIPIVSDGGGLKDAAGDAGVIVKRNDSDELAAAMHRILIDSRLRTDLLSAAKKHLENHLPDVVSRRYMEVIENALLTT